VEINFDIIFIATLKVCSINIQNVGSNNDTLAQLMVTATALEITEGFCSRDRQSSL